MSRNDFHFQDRAASWKPADGRERVPANKKKKKENKKKKKRKSRINLRVVDWTRFPLVPAGERRRGASPSPESAKSSGHYFEPEIAADRFTLARDARDARMQLRRSNLSALFEPVVGRYGAEVRFPLSLRPPPTPNPLSPLCHCRWIDVGGGAGRGGTRGGGAEDVGRA